MNPGYKNGAKVLATNLNVICFVIFTYIYVCIQESLQSTSHNPVYLNNHAPPAATENPMSVLGKYHAQILAMYSIIYIKSKDVEKSRTAIIVTAEHLPH